VPEDESKFRERMTARGIFGIVVRTVGLLIAVYGLFMLVFGVAGLANGARQNGMFLILGFLSLVLGAILMRGSWVANFAYGRGRRR